MVADWVEPLTVETAGGLIAAGIIGVTNGARLRLDSNGTPTGPEWYDPELAERLSSDINRALAAANHPRHFNGLRLREFLKSDEMRSVARMTAAASISQSDEYDAELIGEVAAILEARFPGSPDVAREVGDRFVTGLRRAFDRALAQRDRKNRQPDRLARMLLAQLGHIRLELAKSATTGFSHSAFQSFRDELRLALEERYRLMSPPGFGRTHRLPVADMYVPPPLRRDAPRDSRNRSEDFHEISPLDIAALCHRAVVLGDPGGGKSTLSQALAFQHARRLPGKTERTLAVPIVLRELVGDPGAPGVVGYLERFFRENLALKVPAGCVELALANGTILVIFDGLDELGGKAQRQAVVADVESFCARFPNAPVLVTSRIDGYDLAPLDPHAFSRWRISSFGPDEVKTFVNKWFEQVALLEALETGALPVWNPVARAAAFLRDSERVEDLRENPLLLCLMCGLYKQDGDLPSTRPAVYARCAEMLFQTWDTGRGIATPFLYEDDLKRVLMHLALWMLRDTDLQVGVGRARLHDEIGDYLHSHRYRSRNRALSVARELVNYTTGRAWVFTDTFQDLTEEVYRFTHQTFLEYFAACQLVREAERPENLMDALLDHVTSGEWYVVAPLAVQVMNESVEDGADKFTEIAIRRLLSMTKQDKDRADALFGLVMRYMEYVALRPSTLTSLVVAFHTLVAQVNLDGGILLSTIHRMHRDNRTGLLEAICELREDLYVRGSYVASMITLSAVVHYILYGLGGADEPTDATARGFLVEVAKMRASDRAHLQLIKLYRQWDRGLITEDERAQESVELLVEAFEEGHDMYFVDSDGQPLTERGRRMVAARRAETPSSARASFDRSRPDGVNGA